MISLRLQIFRSSWTFCSHSVRKCSCITFQRNSLFYEIPKSQKPQKSKNLEIPKSKSKCSIQRVEERTKDVLNFYVSKRVPKNDKIGNFSKIGQNGAFSPCSKMAGHSSFKVNDRHQLSTGCIKFEILIFAEVINSNEGDDCTNVKYYCSGQPCTW